MTRTLTLLAMMTTLCVPIMGAEASSEEMLFVRRIALLQQSSEKDIVKEQVELFLKQYPTSAFSDAFCALLGDIAYDNKDYKGALGYYSKAQDPSLRMVVFDKQLSCYDALGDYQKIVVALQPLFNECRTYTLTTASEQRYAWLYANAVTSTKHDKAALHNACGLLRSLESFPEYKQKASSALAAAQKRINDADDSSPVKSEEKMTSEQAMHRARLLFDLKAYQTLADDKEKLFAAASPVDFATMEYLVGRSFFALQQYEKAVECFSDLLRVHERDIPDAKTTLISVIASYYHLQKYKDMDHWVEQLESRYPGDELLAKAFYFQALSCKGQKQTGLVRDRLSRILREFPNFDHMDNVQFEWSCLLLEEQKWQEAREALIAFLNEFPHSPLRRHAFNQLCVASVRAVEKAKADGQPSDVLSEHLVEDLTAMLKTHLMKESPERPQYMLTLAKTLADLHRHPAALQLLTEFLDAYPSHSLQWQAHLLMAVCYYSGMQDPNKFIEHAERALLLNPTQDNYGQLHLNLFSLYVQLAKEKNREANLDKGAMHLYAAIQDPQANVSLTNQIWLASHYYDKVKKYLDVYAPVPLSDDRSIQDADFAIAIYERALGVNREKPHCPLAKEDIPLDGEVFKLAQLLGVRSNWQYQIALLEDLVRQPTGPYMSQSLWSLAQAYQKTGHTKAAIEALQSLTSHHKTADPYIEAASMLQLARLTFASLSKEQRLEGSSECRQVLKLLKDLQVRKSLAQEPIHLEAALEYAHISASLAGSCERDQKLLALLLEARTDFMSQGDIWSKDYHASRKLMPEKDHIYQAYMMLIDAHIARLQSLQSAKDGHWYDAESKKDAAKAIYISLLQDTQHASPFIVDEANVGIQALASISKEKASTQTSSLP